LRQVGGQNSNHKPGDIIFAANDADAHVLTANDFVTVSVDSPNARSAVMKVLQEQRASSRNHLFASDDTATLQDAFDPAMPAAVPFTLLIAPNGDVVHQQVGEADVSSLRRAILANLPDDRAYPGSRAYWSGQ